MIEPDGSLVKRVLAGEPACFRALIERYQDAVFGVALSQTGSFADAEDIAQEAFLEAFESLNTLRKPESFGGWLCSIARSKSRKSMRRDKRRQRREESAETRPPQPSEPEEVAARNEARGQVMSALAKLSDANRETATLYYINGYSTGDISRFTGRPVGTIKRRLHDARSQLRKELVAMVEDELKGSRPGPEFTDRVYQEIARLRVWPSGKGEDVLLLTDSKGRSLRLTTSPFIGSAFQPWLSGEGTSNDMDVHTAVVRALGEFGLKIQSFAFTEAKIVTLGTLRLAGTDGTVEIECPAMDGINLALRAEVSILADEKLVDRLAFKRKDGAPLSPMGAWRRARREMKAHLRNVETVRFRDMAEVVRILETNPEHREARFALTEVAEGFHWTPSRLKDQTGAMDTLKAWVKKCRGTNLEGVAAGLLGSVHLWPLMRPEKAILHLQRAHCLRPRDGKVAFELATAYAMTGRATEAFAVLGAKHLEMKEVPTATDCGNFVDIWDDPRFVSQVGKPDQRCAKVLHIPQLLIVATVGVSPIQPLGTEADGFEIPRISQQRIRGLERTMACGPLLPLRGVALITKLLRPIPKGRRVPRDLLRHLLMLDVAEKGAAALRLDQQEGALVAMVERAAHVREPDTPAALLGVLGGAGIDIDAAVLERRTRAGIKGFLAVSRRGRHGTISIAGGAAVAMALAADKPILVTETLAEKLYIRGKNGRPLRPTSARKRLLK